MKRIFLQLLSVLCFAAAAAAADNFPITAVSAEEIRAALRAKNSQAPDPRTAAPDANQQLYMAGAAERARLGKESRQYVEDEKKRPAVRNAFMSPAPAGVKDPEGYAALGEKNENLLRNVGYWKEQIKGNSSSLAGALRVNDLATANILINHMRHDHWAIISEIDAIQENNVRAETWGMKPTNDQLYSAGEQERAAILEQAAACASLEGRDVPKSDLVSPTPAGIADAAKYEELRARNAGFIDNIEYWRSQLEGNYANLKEDIKANDLETARILLNYMIKDSASLDNELKAVQRNNAEAARL